MEQRIPPLSAGLAGLTGAIAPESTLESGLRGTEAFREREVAEERDECSLSAGEEGVLAKFRSMLEIFEKLSDERRREESCGWKKKTEDERNS